MNNNTIIMHFTARILPVGTPTGNGNIYDPVDIERVTASLSEKEILGQMGMPVGPAIDMADVSHVASNFRIEEGWLLADIKVLDTPAGQMLSSALAEFGQNLDTNPGFGFRTSGSGKVTRVDGVTLVTDFALWSVNAVTNPA